MDMGNRKLIERDASAQPLLTGRELRGIQKGQDSSPAAQTCEEGEKNGNVFDSMVVAVWYLRESAGPKSSFLLLPLSGRQSSWPTYRWERYPPTRTSCACRSTYSLHHVATFLFNREPLGCGEMNKSRFSCKASCCSADSSSSGGIPRGHT